MRKTAIAAAVLLLLVALFLQWGLDRTPAGTGDSRIEGFPSAASLLDVLGGARQYVAYNFFIKTDKLHHTYYGSFDQEAELIPYFVMTALLDPHYESAYYVGSGLMNALGRRQEAIDFNLRGLRANPESADLYYNLGAFYLEEKLFEEAREAFERALEYEPKIVSRNMLLTAAAVSCSALGDEEARRAFMMERVTYNGIRLISGRYEYEELKALVLIINNTLNDVAPEIRP